MTVCDVADRASRTPSACATCPAMSARSSRSSKYPRVPRMVARPTTSCSTATRGRANPRRQAVVNEYADRGLKIIEMSPRHIAWISRCFADHAPFPFRFIVFPDDPTFSREDDNFAALRAFIEGGLAGKPSNLVIYGTSNRRHLIRETSRTARATRCACAIAPKP